MKTRDLTIKELILITVVLLIFPIGLFFWMDGNGPSDLAALLGAFSGLIAVMWFYRGLRLQSIQINEQRHQFIKQFRLQHQDSQLAFLESSSKRLKNSLDDLIAALNISDETQLASAYLTSIPFYKLATESTNPDDVISEIQKWMKIEGPCAKFMTVVRDIVVLYKLRLGMDDDSEGVDPAEYVYINSGHLMKKPFMSPYKTAVDMLSQQMNLLNPGRNAMRLASLSALALNVPKGMMKTDIIIQDIEQAKTNKKLVPKICNELIANQPVEPTS